MSVLSEIGLVEFVYPLPHPDITRTGVVSAYSYAFNQINLRTDRMKDDEPIIRADLYASRKILELFQNGELGIQSGIMDANMEQSGRFWIPVAKETVIGAPMGPVTRALERQIRDSLNPPTNTKKAIELHYLNTLLRAYSTSTLLEIGSAQWRWIAEEIAHELSEKAPGNDDLDNWDRAIRYLEEPILMLPGI